MADPNPTTASANPSSNAALLSQLLALLQQGGSNGTPPSAATLPNQSTNSQTTQTGSGMMTTAPGPAATTIDGVQFPGPPRTVTNANGTFDIAPEGMPSFGGNTSGGNSGYGYQAPGNQMSQSGAANYDTWMNTANETQNSSQFNQLLQGLIKQYQSTPPPTAPATAPITAPLPAPVVNNQAAYTDPSKAVIPGIGVNRQITPPPGTLPSVSHPPPPSTLPGMTTTSDALQAKAATGQITPQTVPPTMAPALADKLQQGTIQPSDVTGAGGPLQASTGSGITQGSLPPQSQTPATASAVQPTPSRSYSTNPFSAPNANTQITLPSNTPGGSGMIGNISGVSGAQVPAGNVTPVTGSTGQVAMPSGIDGASGYVANVPGVSSSQAAASANTPSGGSGMTPQIGSALASGIGKIGSAIAGAYKPITLNVPPLPQDLQNPKPLTFSAPAMTQ